MSDKKATATPNDEARQPLKRDGPTPAQDSGLKTEKQMEIAQRMADGKTSPEEEEKKKKDPSLNISIDLDLVVLLKIDLDLKVHGRVEIGLL